MLIRQDIILAKAGAVRAEREVAATAGRRQRQPTWWWGLSPLHDIRAQGLQQLITSLEFKFRSILFPPIFYIMLSLMRLSVLMIHKSNYEIGKSIHYKIGTYPFTCQYLLNTMWKPLTLFKKIYYRPLSSVQGIFIYVLYPVSKN